MEICPMCGSNEVCSIYERTYQERLWALGRCCRCGLHFTLPPPTEEDISGFYPKTYHEKLLTEGATERHFGAKYERYAGILGRHLPAGSVVDVGCSTGLLVRILCDRGYQAEGVELNHRCAAYGRNHYGVKIHVNPLEQCGYDDESLGAVLMTDVLEHMQNPRDYLLKVRRLLRPGGFVLVTFPDIQSLESLYKFILARFFGRSWIWGTCTIPGHVWEFTKKTARACFESAGFKVVEFSRFQPRRFDKETSALIKVINLPVLFLQLPVASRLFGTQMEFVIRRL